jgi:hypothetical protein
MVSAYDMTAETKIDADTPINISLRLEKSSFPITSSIMGLTEYGKTTDEALLTMIRKNPSNNIYRLGQTIVLNTLAIEILGFFFFSMG